MLMTWAMRENYNSVDDEINRETFLVGFKEYLHLIYCLQSDIISLKKTLERNWWAFEKRETVAHINLISKNTEKGFEVISWKNFSLFLLQRQHLILLILPSQVSKAFTSLSSTLAHSLDVINGVCTNTIFILQRLSQHAMQL